MTEKRMHFVKNKKLSFYSRDLTGRGDGVRLLSTSCDVLQGFPVLRKTISSHV